MSMIVLTFIVPVRDAHCGNLFRVPKNVAAPLEREGVYGKSEWDGKHCCLVLARSVLHFGLQAAYIE
jgi:hypothetical protein